MGYKPRFKGQFYAISISKQLVKRGLFKFIFAQSLHLTLQIKAYQQSCNHIWSRCDFCNHLSSSRQWLSGYFIRDKYIISVNHLKVSGSLSKWIPLGTFQVQFRFSSSTCFFFKFFFEFKMSS